MSEPREYAISVQAIAEALHADHEQAWGPGSSNLSAHRRTAERAVEALAAASLVVVSVEALAEVIRDAETCLRAALPDASARPSGPPQGVVDVTGGDREAGEVQEALEAHRAALARVVKLARRLAGSHGDEIAAAILNLDPTDSRPGRALAVLEQEWT